MVLYSSKTKMVRARENATRERVTLVVSKVMMRQRVMKREVPERVTMLLSDGSR
jgi:hypothetical protein